MDNPQQSSPRIYVRGTKVALGPMMAEYKQFFINSMQDPEFALYGGGAFKAAKDEQLGEFWDTFFKDAHTFAIFELEGLQYIGGADLRNINHRNGTATFGIGIENKAFWGKGYGTEATQLVVEYAFRHLNLYNVGLETVGFNTRAIATYQKVGFKVYGRRRGVYLIDAKRYDEVLMDIIAPEFSPPAYYWTMPQSSPDRSA